MSVMSMQTWASSDIDAADGGLPPRPGAKGASLDGRRPLEKPAAQPAGGVEAGDGQATGGQVGGGQQGPTMRLAGSSDAATSDETLVRLLRDGNVQAGEMLVKRYHQPLLRYLQRIARSEHLAEELHQQTWVSVLDHIDRFDPAQSGGFKAWLFRIATNKAHDHWRSSGRAKKATAGMALVNDDALPDPSHRLDGTEQHHKLRRAIEQLPEPQRQVLMLRYYSNLKFVEIAEMLGCPLNTALGRMHKAIIKLRSVMQEG